MRRANEELNTSWNGIQRNGDEAEVEDEFLAEEFNERKLTAEEKEFDARNGKVANARVIL